MNTALSLESILPHDHAQALLIARVWMPGLGPVLCQVQGQALLDLSPFAATCAHLLALDEPGKQIKQRANFPRLANTREVLANSFSSTANPQLPHFLAPCDLQPIKAAGVTFVASMLERVIEEQARGDAARAHSIRASMGSVVGENLRAVKPGSAQAMQVKSILMAQGLWSQYLEVGIGKDAEVFTKAPVLSSVGVGAHIGIHIESQWNNPEPEVVLAVSPAGRIVGAALGNDVNLRDFEGRSALLLSKAKDNNASCAIGPFIRLFDDDFGLDDVRSAELTLRVQGADGFVLQGSSSMSQISRDPTELVAQTCNANHQYPDGFMLFCGTMFAPTQDRFAAGQGFTHAVGDAVHISSPRLGLLANTVQHSSQCPPWQYGLRDLMRDLARRQLLA
jgi:fumarylacetoacetate (FAA) hydrolase family protein